MKWLAPVAFLLAACQHPPEPVDLRDLVQRLDLDKPASRVLASALGDASDAPPAPLPSYTYTWGRRTASAAPHLQHWAAGGFVAHGGTRTVHQDRSKPYYRDAGAYAGEQFVACWTLNVGKAPGPWPRPAFVLATSRPNQQAVRDSDPKATPLPLDEFGHPGVRLAFVPTLAFEAGNSGGLVDYDEGGRVVLRWTPPEAFVGSVWFLQLLWLEPTGLMTSKGLEFRVGSR